MSQPIFLLKKNITVYVMNEEENDDDPIYGNRIINPYTLGKTTYSLQSLYDWFLTRKCFINPMTNNILNSQEQGNLIDKFIEERLLPNMNYSKMNSYKIVLIMEKHRNFLNEIKKYEDKLVLLNEKLELNKLKLQKARKKEKYEEIIKKINDKIVFQEQILKNLKTS